MTTSFKPPSLMAIALLAFATPSFSCNKSFDLQHHKLIGHTESYKDRSNISHWESQFADKFRFGLESFKYEEYLYKENAIYILISIAPQNEQTKIFFLNPSGQVFELKPEEVELKNGIVRFQDTRFHRSIWGEHDRNAH